VLNAAQTRAMANIKKYLRISMPFSVKRQSADCCPVGNGGYYIRGKGRICEPALNDPRRRRNKDRLKKGAQVMTGAGQMMSRRNPIRAHERGALKCRSISLTQPKTSLYAWCIPTMMSNSDIKLALSLSQPHRGVISLVKK
jgi:hypothetical protein